MQSKKAQPLSGEGNKRLKKHRPTNNAETAAWADIDQLKPESKVSVPSLSNVKEARTGLIMEVDYKNKRA